MKEVCSQILESSIGLLVFREKAFRTWFFIQNSLFKRKIFERHFNGRCETSKTGDKWVGKSRWSFSQRFPGISGLSGLLYLKKLQFFIHLVFLNTKTFGSEQDGSIQPRSDGETRVQKATKIDCSSLFGFFGQSRDQIGEKVSSTSVEQLSELLRAIVKSVVIRKLEVAYRHILKWMAHNGFLGLSSCWSNDELDDIPNEPASSTVKPAPYTLSEDFKFVFLKTFEVEDRDEPKVCPTSNFLRLGESRSVIVRTFACFDWEHSGRTLTESYGEKWVWMTG